MIRHPRYWLYDTRHRLKFVLTGDCGHACDWAQPWGWVPEDGCPVHDIKSKERLELMVDTSDGWSIAAEIKQWVSTPSGERLVGEVKLWPKP